MALSPVVNLQTNALVDFTALKLNSKWNGV